MLTSSKFMASPLMLRRDIADNVFAYLYPGPRPEEDAFPSEKSARKQAQRTLACAALVCRALSDAAQDVLWSCVDDPLNLLSIFPSFVKNAEDGNAYVSKVGIFVI